MTLDIEKIKQAALADTEDEIHWESSAVLKLIERERQKEQEK